MIKIEFSPTDLNGYIVHLSNKLQLTLLAYFSIKQNKINNMTLIILFFEIFNSTYLVILDLKVQRAELFD